MNPIRRYAAVAGTLTLAATLGACGGGGSCPQGALDAGVGAANCEPPITVPTPRPTPAPTPVVLYEDSGTLPAQMVGYVEFGVPAAGTVQSTVDWTFADSEVFIVMTSAACDDYINAYFGSCSQIGPPNLGRSKPKTVSGTVSGATTARLWVANTTAKDESVALQVVFTRLGAAGEGEVLRSAVRGRWVLVGPARDLGGR
jgi:hypothetical protein